jgi:hypothetical protein
VETATPASTDSAKQTTTPNLDGARSQANIGSVE